jgi:hypothetical protein
MVKAPAILLTTCWGKIFEDQGPFVTWNGQIRWQRMRLSCSKLLMPKNGNANTLLCAGESSMNLGAAETGGPLLKKNGFPFGMRCPDFDRSWPNFNIIRGLAQFQRPILCISCEVPRNRISQRNYHWESSWQWPNKSIFFISRFEM